MQQQVLVIPKYCNIGDYVTQTGPKSMHKAPISLRVMFGYVWVVLLKEFGHHHTQHSNALNNGITRAFYEMKHMKTPIEASKTSVYNLTARKN